MPIPAAIYGLFPDPESAVRGMHALNRAGISPKRIIVMSEEPFDGYSFSEMDGATPMPWIAVIGGAVGGTLGFLLARLTQEAYPYPLITGGMPLLAANAHAVKVVGKENHRSDVQQPGTQLVVDRGVQKNEIWFPVA